MLSLGLRSAYRVVRTGTGRWRAAQSSERAERMVRRARTASEPRTSDDLAFALKLPRAPEHLEHVLIVDRKSFQQLMAQSSAFVRRLPCFVLAPPRSSPFGPPWRSNVRSAAWASRPAAGADELQAGGGGASTGTTSA